MSTQLHVLLLEDNASDAELVLHALRQAGYDPIAERVETEQDYRNRLQCPPEIILADFSMPEFDSLRALQIIKEDNLDIPFIIVSGTIGEERAVRVMQDGAADYIIKDRLGRLGQAVEHALEKKRTRTETLLSERRLNAQHATTKVLADSPNLETAIPQIIEAVCKSMGWVWAAVWMVDSPRQRLALTQFWHLPEADLSEFQRVSFAKTFERGEGLPGRVWSTSEPAWLPNVMDDENFFGKHAAAQAGLHAALFFPIMIRNEVVGIMEFFSQYVEQPNSKILEMMTAIGSQIGQFIDRKRVDEGLRLFRTLIDRTTDGIEVIDPKTGRFLDANEKTCAAHGYSREEFLKLSVPDVDPLVACRTWEVVIKEHQQEGSRTYESMHRRKDGSTFPVEVNFNSIRLNRDYVVKVVRDITERKQLEDQYRQSQKMEAFGQLAGGVAHDFNNLLTVILGYSELLLLKLPIADPGRESMGEIRRAAERAAALTSQLLAFGRKQILTPVVLDLNCLLAEIEKMLRRLIGADIELIVTLQPGLGWVKVDPGQIEQIIMNLAVNARDAMPTGGRLTISTRDAFLTESQIRRYAELAHGPYTVLAVSDTGSGMDEATKARVFEPFFTTKDIGKGTGLGLATVFGIVKQSDGFVEVESELGVGTTFQTYLPQSREKTRPEEDEYRPAIVPTGVETILLVEDEEGVRNLARLILEASGYKVLCSKDGREAEEFCHEFAGVIDLLFTDVVMPKMSGPQLTNLLLPSRPGMKVLYMSGYTDDTIIRHGIHEAGANFLPKPFTSILLTNKVREVLDAASVPQGTVPAFAANIVRVS